MMAAHESRAMIRVGGRYVATLRLIATPGIQDPLMYRQISEGKTNALVEI
jgi:hypothetical protein